MKTDNIIEAEQDAIKFLRRIQEVRSSIANKSAFDKSSLNTNKHTYTSKETGALKRTSMDLTRSLAKMRNITY